MTDRVKGKVAIVSGASRGVGLADAKLLAAEGAKVILADINTEQGENAAAEIGNAAQFIEHDVSNEQHWKDLIASVEQDYGRLDILVNNAAILQVGGIDAESLEGWRRVQSVNAESVFLGIQNALPLMEKSGGGSIINMSSSSAAFGMPWFIAYSASKAAVRSITKVVAVHCYHKENNVRCNSIHPDGIATEMVQEIAEHMPEMDGAKAMQAISYTCMPEDVANLVLFLASDESAAMNGAAVNIDKAATITPPYL